ncbi:MAG TPA: GAF domain-containing protein, partial [Anaerolineae bacterium]|nr:GAF domain-containing protein [Anaerolineae bacterium]
SLLLLSLVAVAIPFLPISAWDKWIMGSLALISAVYVPIVMHFYRRHPEGWPGYVTAVLDVLIVTLAYYRLGDALPAVRGFFPLSIAAVSIFWGLKQGLLSAVLSALGYAVVTSLRYPGVPGMVFDHILTMSMYLSMAIFTGVLAQELRRRRNTAEKQARWRAALSHLGDVISSSLTLDEALERALDTVAEVVDLPVVVIHLLAETHGELLLAAQHGLPDESVQLLQRVRVGEPIVGVVAQTGRPIIIQDVMTDPHFGEEATPRLGGRSAAVVPLWARDQVMGTLNMGGPERHLFSEDEVAFVKSVGRVVGLALENVRLYEQAREQRTEEQTALLRLSQALLPIADLDEIANVTAAFARQALNADAASVLLVEGEKLALRGASGWTEPQVGKRTVSLDPDSSEVAWAVVHRQPRQIDDHLAGSLTPQFVLEAGVRATLVVPMLADGETAGAVLVDYMEPHSFSEDEVHLLSLISNQAAVALERAKLYQQTLQHVAELEARHQVMEAVLRSPNLDERLSAALTETLQLLNVEMGGIYLVERDRFILRAHQGLPDDFLVRMRDRALADTPWVGEATARREHLSERGGQIDETCKLVGIQSWLSAPLTVEDHLLGSIVLASRRYDAFPDEAVGSLRALAAQIAVATQSARLYEEAARRLVRLEVLRDVDRAIIQHLSLEEIMQVVLEGIPPDLGAEAVAVSLLDSQGQRQTVFAMRLPNGTIIHEEAFSLSEVLLHWLVERQEPVIIYDLGQDPRVQLFRDRIRAHHLTSYLGVPLVVQGQTIGILHILTTEPRVFADEDIAFFVTLAGQAAIAMHNARLFQNLVQARNQLQVLSTQLLHAQEEERTRIARDLHDDIGQSLTALKLELQMLRADLVEQRPDLQEQTDRCVELAGHALERTRALSGELRPPDLDRLGLAVALRKQVDDLTRRTEATAYLEVQGMEARLPAEIETALYRIAQEALTNVACHANASRVSVRLERTETEVTLCVEDDGVGFDADHVLRTASQRERLGLLGMRERARLVGGTLQVASRPGVGTRLEIRVPLSGGDDR